MPKYTSIQEPTPTIEGLYETVKQLKQVIETLVGAAPGAEGGQAVTLDDIPVLFTQVTYSPLEAFNNPALQSSATYLAAQVAIAEANQAVARSVELLEASVDENSAAIVAESIARIAGDEGAADATILQSVDALGAGGATNASLRLQATSAPAGVTSRFQVQLSTQGVGDDFVSAGFYLDIMADTTRRFVIDADRFVFNDGETTPFYVSGGTTYLTGAVIKDAITSVNTKLVVDFANNKIEVYD